MDTRMGAVLGLGALALSGCAGVRYAPLAGAGMVATEAGSDPTAGPQTAEDRAEAVLDTTAQGCVLEGEACAVREHVTHYPYPDVEVPASQRYYPSSLPQEVASVGVEARFDPGTGRYELERGNTLAYPSNQDPDGSVP